MQSYKKGVAASTIALFPSISRRARTLRLDWLKVAFEANRQTVPVMGRFDLTVS